MAMVKRFEVYLVNLDPTIGSEIQKTRPCLVISPDELNRPLATVIVAPLTTHGKSYPFRVSVTFDGKAGHIALDQIRTVDKTRLVKRLGEIDETTRKAVITTLAALFADDDDDELDT